MSAKGFAFKGRGLKVEKAPEALRAAALSPESESVKPTKVTTAVKKEVTEAKKPAQRSMFSDGAPVYVPPKPKVVAKPKPKVLAPEVQPNSAASLLEKMSAKAASIKEAEAEEAEAEDAVFEEAGDFKEMADLVKEEEEKSPYELEGPKVFVPETRRGFSDFIKRTYESFMLESLKDIKSTPAGDKYPYQKFIREYMRQESPYRGILVYHGLGSGKTCTAIAAAEALYSSSNKKIIVMTPASLRKNFLKEVTACGFRHFRLKNYWIGMDKSDPEVLLFAQSVLGIPFLHLRTAQKIWIPDFRKTADEANYSSLEAGEQTEIRRQILSILVWDPVDNPEGRIRFINYNGFSAKKLQDIACKEPHADFFDDAVIIIDEIHNVTRLMRGKIDPYLVRMKGKSRAERLMPLEAITVNKWKPTLCSQLAKTYLRGYSFYRLLLDARNSKIVGLSGTPIINLPEEIAILMNVLHGYIPTLDGVIQQTGEAAHRSIRDIALKHKYVDFVSVSAAVEGGTKVVFTFLPYGIRKVNNDSGVERIPVDEPVPNIDEVIQDVRTTIEAGGFTFSKNTFVKAVPLLPPIGQDFRDRFINMDSKTDVLKNKIVLLKRLTGMISYYKGNREDLMPRIKSDEVVRVPMSQYSQGYYSNVRIIEINKFEKFPTKTTERVWEEVYQLGQDKKTNYKVASRQACNFTFPPSVTRPPPKTKKDVVKKGVAVDGDMIEMDTGFFGASDDAPGEDEFPELKDDTEAVQEEDAAMEEASEAPEVPPAVAVEQKGGQPIVPATSRERSAQGFGIGLEEPAPKPVSAPTSASVPVPAPASVPVPVESESSLESETSLESEAEAPVPSEPLPPLAPKKTGFLQAKFAQKMLALKGDCKAGKKPGEDDDVVMDRCKECLRTIARDSMIIGGDAGLELYSPKYAAILKRIEEAPGSSLVYSDFLELEGIGIFRIAMDLNGYAPIEIEKADGRVRFTSKTVESLKKGPGAQSRYMVFSGGEGDDIRRLSLDIFNANFNELPQNLKKVLEENGYTNNHKGEIARVFCITSAGAEGLSLKCVRAVHIMEPFWNDVRLKQVKGRAVRIGSHLELPEEQRDVRIYTYLSVFSEEAKAAKTGPMKIDETLRGHDGAETVDETVYAIGQKKKAITDALESVMKSAAIDCELNIKQNFDGTFKCDSLKGSVGDFLYHPDIDIDIRESASKYGIAPSAAAKPASAVPEPNFILKKLKDTIYRMKEIKDSTTGVVTGFEMYAADDKTFSRLLGKSGAKDGKPAPPVNFV